MQPLVSTVSLLYNIKPEYVTECIKSLLNQTYQNIEIIFVDDCSNKYDYQFITTLSPKIKLYKNDKNLGCSKNTQKAFELAQGKYIVKIDSDDYIDSTLIEKEVNFLENNLNYGAVCCELQRFGLNKRLIRRPQIWTLYEALFRDMGKYGYAGGMMFKAELLEKIKIDYSLRVCEDFDFHLQILEHSKIKSIHEPLYFYRSHDSNIMISSRGGERIKIVKQILEKHAKIYNERHGTKFRPRPKPIYKNNTVIYYPSSKTTMVRIKKPRFGSKKIRL